MSVQEILLLFLSQLFLPNLNWFNLVDNQHVLKHQGFNYFSVCTENTIGIGTNQCENIILEITYNAANANGLNATVVPKIARKL